MSYAINEIFYSIQGEGVRAGTANVFVRFQACNLQCSADGEAGFDCDTEFESGRSYELDELTYQINEHAGGDANAVIFTGGEPALQVDDDLIDAFRRESWFLAIETNGTTPLPKTRLDWVCLSPKTAFHTIKVNACDEFKLVRHVGQELPKKIPCTAGYKLVSPAFNAGGLDPANLEWCINLVKRNPEWRLSVQQHKTWGVR